MINYGKLISSFLRKNRNKNIIGNVKSPINNGGSVTSSFGSETIGGKLVSKYSGNNSLGSVVARNPISIDNRAGTPGGSISSSNGLSDLGEFYDPETGNLIQFNFNGLYADPYDYGEAITADMLDRYPDDPDGSNCKYQTTSADLTTVPVTTCRSLSELLAIVINNFPYGDGSYHTFFYPVYSYYQSATVDMFLLVVLSIRTTTGSGLTYEHIANNLSHAANCPFSPAPYFGASYSSYTLDKSDLVMPALANAAPSNVYRIGYRNSSGYGSCGITSTANPPLWPRLKATQITLGNSYVDGRSLSFLPNLLDISVPRLFGKGDSKSVVLKQGSTGDNYKFDITQGRLLVTKLDASNAATGTTRILDPNGGALLGTIQASDRPLYGL